MSIINRLQPVSFTWREGGFRDLGFGAEEVEKIEPLLVTYNPQRQVEGIKYDRITVALVNAIKEQQAQIEELRSLKTENENFKAQLADLRARVEMLERATLNQQGGHAPVSGSGARYPGSHQDIERRLR